MNWIDQTDKVKASSLILNVILLILLCLSGMVMRIPCPEQIINQVVQIDTVRPADVPVKIAEGKPIVRKYVNVKLPKIDKSNNDKSGNANTDTPELIPSVSHQEPATIKAAVYSDTLYKPDNYRAIINDTVNGEIIGRSVWFVNLKPEVTKTITNTIMKREKVGIYIGAIAQMSNDGAKGWGVGPAALVTIPGAIAVGYAYNVNRGLHTATLLAPIRFGKLK